MSRIISMQDIRQSLATIADRAQAGETFIVIRNSKPVFRITPPEDRSGSEQRSLRGLRALTERLDGVVAGERLSSDELDEIIHDVHRAGQAR